MNKTVISIGLILTAGAMSLLAQNGTWNADASGNWSDTSKWLGGIVADGTGNTADFSTINITADRTVTLDAAHTLSTLKFGDAVVADHNWFLSGANTLTFGTTPVVSVVNQTATISSLLAGTAFTKLGVGTLKLNGAAVNTFTGTMVVKGGTLTEDFSNLATPTDLINNGVILSLGGGTMSINGAASGATSQTFASTSFGPGANAVNVINNGTSATAVLKALTVTQGATVQFSTTGTITTTTAGTGGVGLLGIANSTANPAGYATVGTSDWASTDVAAGTAGTSPYTILPMSSVTGGYVIGTTAANLQGTPNPGNVNLDLQANITETGNSGASTVRFNTPTATTITENGKWLIVGGFLITPNMAANNAVITGTSSWFADYSTGVAQDGVVWQNNTAAYFNINCPVGDGRDNTGSPLTYIQSGSGTVIMGKVNSYIGQSYLNGGFTAVGADSGLGAIATGANVNLYGGTVVATNSFTMDNGGANKRPFTIGGNGGGLAATAGNTMTIDGIVGSATAGVGALTVGIPASSANGSTQGLLPGSGTGTANTTPVMATGTVALTGANTYSGGTIVQNAALSFATGSLGTGGLSIYGGTLQWNAATTDISAQTVTIGAGGATFDVNGNTVMLANSIGNNGTGSLTVLNSGVNGGLILNGGSSYTGGTTVNSGATLGGTGTIAGNVVWNTGAAAALTQGSPMTVSGTVTLNSTTVKVTASGLTTGSYTLLTAAGGITGGSTVNSAPSGSGIVASGYTGTIAISGNSIVFNVVQLGVAAIWTDGNADQNWTDAGNWSGGVPHNPGDAATFGSGGVGVPVNLNINETMGAMAFTNTASYVITNANNVLTLDNSTHGATVTVTAGTSNAVNTSVSLNDNLTVSAGSGASLAVGGPIANKTVSETLTVNGGGTVVFSGTNTYGPSAGFVGTTISGATVQLANNSALGAGDVSVTDNSTLQAGLAGLMVTNNVAIAVTKTATVDSDGNNLTILGVITGNGAVTKIGNGTLALAGANTYVGNTTISGGALSLSSSNNVTSPNVVLNGGDLVGAGTFALTNNLKIGLASGAATTTGLLDAASTQTLTVSNAIVSAGNLGINNLTVNSGAGNNGTVVLSVANTFNGTNIIAAGVEQLASPLALQDSILNYNNQGGTLDFTTLTTVSLGGLTGSQNLTLVNDSSAAVNLSIGNNNTTSTYLGNLGDSGLGAALNKEGSGTITLGSAGGGGASYSGATTINNGTLTLDGNGTLTLNAGGNNLQVSGALGASALNLVDSAVVTTSGGVYLGSEPTGGSDGGNGFPGVCSLTVQNNASLTAATLNFGGVGVSTRLPNCTFTLTNNASVNVSGAFQLGNIAGSAAPTGQVNLNGGTLSVGQFLFTSAATTRPVFINFNGGTLAANASDPGGSTFMPVFAGLTVNLLANGGSINPNGNTITISPTLSGAGGLTNSGSGTLILPGANTYAGGTLITNTAILDVINTTGSATGTNSVTVASGATLEGTGIIAGTVTWQSGALATFNAGSVPSAMTVGAVTLNNNSVTVNVPGATPLGIGSYTLLNYTAAGSTGVFNSVPGFTGAGLASGLNASISTGGGIVTLVVTPNVTASVWDVDANGSWTDATKWSSNPTVPGNPGDAATLGVGSALRTVTLNANESLGYLSLTNASSFVIANGGHVLTLDNNSSGAYLTVSGGSANLIQAPLDLNDNSTIALQNGAALTIQNTIANSPSVTKTLTVSGSGQVNLKSANSYGPAAGSPGTILNSGIVQVDNNGALGAGDLNVTGSGTLQSGAAGIVLTNNISVNSGSEAFLDDMGNSFTLGGVLTGGGLYQKIGAGTLLLTNNNGYSGALFVTNGTLILSGDNSGASGTVTNGATLQLAHPNAVASSILALNNNSTLQLRADIDTTFNSSSIGLQNASDTLNFDVRPLTAAASHTLTLNGTLAFANNSSQSITVTGNSTYTLALGAITLTAATSHNPVYSLNISTLPAGAGVTVAQITSGNWGNYVNFNGGGGAAVTGNLQNTSNGSIDLFVNSGSTVTLQGSTVKSATGDAYRYSVQNGTLVVDNNAALINDTTGTGLSTSYLFLGAATNVFYGTAIVPATGVLLNTNNTCNAAIYLGDANNSSGGLTLPATVTNYVSDGDAGFVNGGTFTIGGQNTSGVNTYANPIILGWNPNQGKSVTLVAAPNGEVDFSGNILANGSDTTAGITVGNPAFTGVVKLLGTNTYGGATVISNGVLALANIGFDASINHSSRIFINAGATLDVSSRSDDTLPVGANGFSQVLQGGGTVNGNVVVGTAGTLSPGSASATANLTVSGSTTLGGATVMKLNRASLPTNDLLTCASVTVGGTLTVTNIGPALVPGNTFKLFSTPVSGFTTVSLPASDNGFNYTWNNQLAANGSITVATAVPSVNTNPATANFKAVSLGTALQFTWAPDHLGWQLYTNSVGLTATGSWFPVVGSAAVTNETISINPSKPNVFFQLRYP